MSLINRIRDFFSTAAPPTLRNKPGGMAWIKPFGQDMGAGVLAGRIVQTVRLNETGALEIKPAQQVRCTSPTYFAAQKIYAIPGDRINFVGLNDDVLEPIGNPGHTEQDESLRYLPPVPTSTKVPSGVPV